MSGPNDGIDKDLPTSEELIAKEEERNVTKEEWSASVRTIDITKNDVEYSGYTVNVENMYENTQVMNRDMFAPVLFARKSSLSAAAGLGNFEKGIDVIHFHAEARTGLEEIIKLGPNTNLNFEQSLSLSYDYFRISGFQSTNASYSIYANNGFGTIVGAEIENKNFSISSHAIIENPVIRHISEETGLNAQGAGLAGRVSGNLSNIFNLQNQNNTNLEVFAEYRTFMARDVEYSEGIFQNTYSNNGQGNIQEFKVGVRYDF